MDYRSRVKDWFRKAQSGDKMLIRRMYCMRDGYVTEHEYKTREIDGLEFYREYSCLKCGLTTGFGKKIQEDDVIDDRGSYR